MKLIAFERQPPAGNRKIIECFAIGFFRRFYLFFIFTRSAKALSIDNRKDSGGKTELTKVKNIPMCICISILCVRVSYNIYMQTRQRLFAKRDELDAPSCINPPISFQYRTLQNEYQQHRRNEFRCVRHVYIA